MKQRSYEEKRNEIVLENANLMGVVLSDSEKQLDRLFQQYKNEYKSLYSGDVPYKIPTLTDEKIRNSKLYDFLLKMPKGSDLHVHGSTLLPMHEFFDFLSERNDIFINTKTFKLTSNKKEKHAMTFREALSSKAVTEDQLMNHWTITGVKHKENRWRFFENVFSYFEAVDEDMTVLHDYYVRAFEYYVMCGIFHVEVHTWLPDDIDLCIDSVRTIRDAYYEVRGKHPGFVASVIGCGMKMFDVSFEETKHSFEICLKTKEEVRDEFDPENIHDFVLGFDLINEEDTSRPLRDYAELLTEFKEQHPDFKYFLHSGESLEADSDNLIDAYLIGADRVGHAINLYRYPSLLRQYAEKEICIEACLLSNRSLGYVKDLRLHPILEYLKRGLIVALCSDDPMYFEYQTLTDDFFAAAICWNLGIADIKQLAINSILYSALNAKTKSMLIKSWKIAWDSFVENNI